MRKIDAWRWDSPEAFMPTFWKLFVSLSGARRVIWSDVQNGVRDS